MNGRVEKYNTYWISQAELIQFGVSEKQLRTKYRNRFNQSVPADRRTQDVMPDTGKSWRYAIINGQYYYDLNRIPARTLTKLGINPTELNATDTADTVSIRTREVKQELTRQIKQLINKTESLSLVATGKCTTTEANNKAWLAAALNWIFKNATGKRKISILNALLPRPEVMSLMLNIMEENAPNTLKSMRALRRYIEKHTYPVTATDLLHGNIGNQNRRIVGATNIVNIETGEVFPFDVHQALMYTIYMNIGQGNKLHLAGRNGVYAQYVEAVESFGAEPVALTTVRTYLSSFTGQALTAMERHGVDYANEQFNTYVPRFLPEFSNSVWCIDFSGTKLLYRNDKNKADTLYACRIIDCHSGAVVGYHTYKSKQGESFDDVKPALEMALKTSNNTPAYSLISDNGAAFTAKDANDSLNLIFKHVNHIKKGNKQANPAERYVRILSNYARRESNWRFSGYTAGTGGKIDNRANTDHLNINELPNFTQALQQFADLIHDYNNEIDNKHGVSRIQQYHNNFNPEVQPISDVIRRCCFAASSNIDLSYCRGHIKVVKNKKQYSFSFPNWYDDFQTVQAAIQTKRTDLQVNIRFDEYSASLFTLDGRYIMDVPATKRAHMGIIEANTESFEALSEHTANKEHYTKSINEFIENAKEARNLLYSESEPLTYAESSNKHNQIHLEERNIPINNTPSTPKQDDFDEYVSDEERERRVDELIRKQI